jgi:hypothetical protein
MSKNPVFALLIVTLFVVFTAIGESQEGLLLWFPFEGSGDVAEDQSGNGNDGTIVDATRVKGKYGKGIQIGKKDQYVEITNILQPMGTIEFWFKPNWDGSDGDTYRLFDANTGSIYYEIGKGKETGGRTETFGFYFEDASDADFQDWQIPATDAIPKAGEWYHIAATWDFEKEKKAHFFINGEEVGDVAGIGQFPQLNPNPKIGFNVGTGYMAAANGADGVIDEFAIYGKALSADEIKRDMEKLFLAVEPSDKLATMWGRIKR